MKSLKEFQSKKSVILFPNAQHLPALFQNNLVDPARVVKIFKNDPQANIRCFYYQYLKLCFQLQNVDYEMYIHKIEEIVNNQDFKFVFYEEDDPQIYNDLQFKQLIMEFFALLGQGGVAIEEVLNNYPFIDTVFIYFFRSILILRGMADSLHSFIDRVELLQFFSTHFYVKISTYGKCIKFQETDIFVYEQNPNEVYMAYMDYDCLPQEDNQQQQSQKNSQDGANSILPDKINQVYSATIQQIRPLGSTAAISSSLQSKINNLSTNQKQNESQLFGDISPVLKSDTVSLTKGNKFNSNQGAESMNMNQDRQISRFPGAHEYNYQQIHKNNIAPPSQEIQISNNQKNKQQVDQISRAQDIARDKLFQQSKVINESVFSRPIQTLPTKDFGFSSIKQQQNDNSPSVFQKNSYRKNFYQASSNPNEYKKYVTPYISPLAQQKQSNFKKLNLDVSIKKTQISSNFNFPLYQPQSNIPYQSQYQSKQYNTKKNDNQPAVPTYVSKNLYGLNVSLQFTNSLTMKSMIEPYKSNVYKIRERARNYRKSLIRILK